MDGEGEGILTDMLASVGVAVAVAVCGTGVTPPALLWVRGGAVGVAVSVAVTVDGTGVTPDVAVGKSVAVPVAVGAGSFIPDIFVDVGYGCRHGVPAAVAVGGSCVVPGTEIAGSTGVGEVTRTQADKIK